MMTRRKRRSINMKHLVYAGLIVAAVGAPSALFGSCLVVTCPAAKSVPCGTAWSFDTPTVLTNSLPVCLAGGCFGYTMRVISTVSNGVCPRNYTRTWDISNTCGEDYRCSQTISEINTNQPVFQGVANISLYSCTSTQVFYNVTASEACCGGLAVTCSPPSGYSFPPGVMTYVTCTATDCCGRSYSTNFYVYPMPTTNQPVFQGADNIVLYSCTSTQVFYNVTATETGCGSLPVTCSPPSGFSFPPGVVTFVECTTRDCCGRTFSKEFYVYPIQPEVLSVSCTDKYVGCTDTNWTFDPPAVYDSCCPGNYTFYPQPAVTNGTTCPLIITEVWGVTDSCGNSNYCTETVYVTNTPTMTANPGLYQVVDLGTLGGNESEAFGINNSGQIVGSAANAGGVSHATFWANATSPPVDLGTVYGAAGPNVALGINDSNQIVGYSFQQSVYPYGNSRATYWEEPGATPLDLGTFPASGDPSPLNSAAYGINDAGQIVGYAEGYSGGRFTGAAYWANRYSYAQEIAGNAGQSVQANAINASGLIVGSANGDNGEHASSWSSPNDSDINLGDDGEALAVSASGQAVGYVDSRNGVVATLFGRAVLGGLGDQNDTAKGINASGQIVGSSFTSGTPHAVLWSGNYPTDPLWLAVVNPAIDLNNSIPTNSGWVLYRANAINDSGEIVGAGTYNGQFHAFALIPAPPSNDQLAGAMVLTNGVPFELDTTSATSDNKPLPTCETNFGKGVWFDYTPVITGPITVSSCGSSFDTVLQAYTGSAGALTPVAGGCNSGYGPACPTNIQASITFQATAGVSYHILAGGSMGASGLLRIEVRPGILGPTPPVHLTMGTFTLQVVSYDTILWDPNSGAFTGASGYAQTTLTCDSASYNCIVHFESLTIALSGAPDQGVVTGGTASYPTSPPQGPSLAIPVAGFTLLFDSLSLQPSQANAQIRLRFPQGLIDPAVCGPPELPLGSVSINAGSACELPAQFTTLSYGPWVVGETGITIQGIGVTADFSTSWSEGGLPASWRGVVLGFGTTVSAASRAITSNSGFLLAPYAFNRGLVSGMGFSGQLELTGAYDFNAAQPLGYRITLNSGWLDLTESAITGGDFQNGTIVLPGKAVRDLSGGSVMATYHDLSVIVAPGLGLYGQVTVDSGFSWGELTGATPQRAYALTQGNWTLRGSVYFSGSFETAYWPLFGQGIDAQFSEPIQGSASDPSLLRAQHMQGLTMEFPEGYSAYCYIFTPDKDPFDSIEKGIPGDPIRGAVVLGYPFSIPWLNIGAQGVHGHLTLSRPYLEMLGDTNSLYYNPAAKTNFITLLATNELKFVDSAVFHSTGEGLIYLGEPTGTNLPISKIAFTSTAHLPSAEVMLPTDGVRLDYWRVDLVQTPNADAAGVVSFKTGEIFLTGAGIQEKHHFAQPINFLWGAIYANGNWDTHPLLDLNYGGQQFDGFNYAPEAFLFSQYDGDPTGAKAYFQVGGPISFDFFGAKYMNILDHRYDAQAGSPFLGRKIELCKATVADLPTSELHLGQKWGSQALAPQLAFGDLEFDIDYDNAGQDGFVGTGTTDLPSSFLSGSMRATVTLVRQSICFSIAESPSDSHNTRLPLLAVLGSDVSGISFSSINAITGCGCIKDGALQQIFLSADLGVAGGVLIASGAAEVMYEAIITPDSASIEVSGDMFLNWAPLNDLEIKGDIKLVTTFADSSVDAEIEAEIGIGNFMGLLVTGSGKLNWHLAADAHWLQGRVAVNVWTLSTGAGVEGGFFAGLNTPQNRIWVISQEDPRYALDMTSLPRNQQGNLSGFYGYLQVAMSRSFIVVSGGVEAFAGVGAFFESPVSLPTVKAHCGAHVWGKILGGLVSADGWAVLELGLGPPPDFKGTSFHGTVGLEGCVLWVGCASVHPSVTIDENGLSLE
jgi:probable HAF family extracellular repeat protein